MRDCSIDLKELNKTLPDPANDVMMIDAMMAYSLFFPVFKESNFSFWHNKLDLNPLQSLDDYELLTLPDVGKITDMGDLIRHMINQNGLELIPDINRIVLETFMADLTLRLRIDGVQNMSSMVEFLGYFAYEPEAHSLLQRERSYNVRKHKVVKDCDEIGSNFTDFSAFCNHPGLSEGCLRYCSLVEEVLSDKAKEDQITELYNMTLDDVNRPVGNSSQSFLPSCTWSRKGRECWYRVVTDKGVCFTSYFKGKRNAQKGARNCN